MADLFLFAIAIFLGVELVQRVPLGQSSFLSGTTALTGTTALGAMLLVNRGQSWLGTLLAGAAVFFAMITLVGGLFLTDRASPNGS